MLGAFGDNGTVLVSVGDALNDVTLFNSLFSSTSTNLVHIACASSVPKFSNVKLLCHPMSDPIGAGVMKNSGTNPHGTFIAFNVILSSVLLDTLATGGTVGVVVNNTSVFQPSSEPIPVIKYRAWNPYVVPIGAGTKPVNSTCVTGALHIPPI